jgi:hypothetical protein
MKLNNANFEMVDMLNMETNYNYSCEQKQPGGQ